MKTALSQGELLIKQGPANLQKGPENVGGRLHMTTRRIIFEAHKINIQGGPIEIDLADIHSTEKCWTRFLGVVPLMPNGLAIYTKTGIERRFTVFGRGAWAAAIDAQKCAIAQANGIDASREKA